MSNTYGTWNQNGESMVWLDYIDIANDVKPWMQIPAGETTWDTQLQLLTTMACQWAQRKLGQPIGPTRFSRKFNGWTGWNGAYIMLPYYPILEITEVFEWWGISGPHNLQESTFTNQVDGFQITRHTGLLTRVFPGLVQKPWFPGSLNIQVDWTAGWNPIPTDWKVATLEFVAHWFRNVFQQSSNSLGSTGTGDSYDPEVVANGLWQGEPLRIASLLNTANQIGMG
jgi:hypothetical protein